MFSTSLLWVLLCAGERDETFPVWHSSKFASTLQRKLTQELERPHQRHPLLLRVTPNVGHVVTPDEYAEMFAFAARVVQAKWVFDAK